jgi:hypothetical protein
VLPKYAIYPPKPKKVTNQKKSHKLEKPYYSICDFFLAYFGSTRYYYIIIIWEIVRYCGIFSDLQNENGDVRGYATNKMIFGCV